MNKVRNWEKGTSAPIPLAKYERFKETLIEYSEKNAERNLMLFILGRATGYRLGDLVGLTIGQLKDALEDGYFYIQESKQYEQWKAALQEDPKTKRKKPEPRRYDIGKNLKKHLSEYVKGKKRSEYAFPSNKNQNEHISRKAYSSILREVGKSMGLKNISGHSLRKTYATKLYIDSNKDIEYVRVAINHQSLEETKRYLGIKEQMIREAAQFSDEDI